MIGVGDYVQIIKDPQALKTFGLPDKLVNDPEIYNYDNFQVTGEHARSGYLRIEIKDNSYLIPKELLIKLANGQ